MDYLFNRDTVFGKVDTETIIILSCRIAYRVVFPYESINRVVLLHGGATLFIAIKEKKQNIFGFFITGVLIVTKLTVYPYELLFILVILIAVSFESTIKNEMMLKVISIISRGSFALYLIHPIVLQIATRVWNKANNSTILYAIYLYVMCIAISYILYYGVVIKIERMINDKFIYNADAERYRAL